MRGIYPGSFDPITYGHRDIIRRAVHKLCDELVIAVANNSTKRPMFSNDERITMIKAEISDMGLENKVSVTSFSGLLTHFVGDIGADVVVRGLRAVSDFEYEFQMAFANNKLDADVETVFLMASEQHHFTASSLVREIAHHGGDISHFVSPQVKLQIQQKLG